MYIERKYPIKKLRNMDCGRRSRRCNRRNNYCRQGPSCGSPIPKSGGFFNGFCNFLIMSALMALIYMMLEYHCTTCKAKYSYNCITKNIDDIMNNLSHLKNSYHDLEVKLSRFSEELPRLEGQLEILETFTRTLDKHDFGLGWDPRARSALPNVDVYLAKIGCSGKNVSHLMNPAHLEGCKNNTCLKHKNMEKQKPNNVLYFTH